jgi:hypothetical protein
MPVGRCTGIGFGIGIVRCAFCAGRCAAGRGKGTRPGAAAGGPGARICRSRAKSSIFTRPANISRANCRGSRGISGIVHLVTPFYPRAGQCM